MAKHKNDGHCSYCVEILNKYDRMHVGLKGWFQNLQLHIPEAHISCAGRGRQEQTELFNRKASNAQYGESAHNYNAAIDLFRNKIGHEYEISWYLGSIKPFLEDWLCWYGQPKSEFWELPHIQVREWRLLVKNKLLTLVEPESEN